MPRSSRRSRKRRRRKRLRRMRKRQRATGRMLKSSETPTRRMPRKRMTTMMRKRKPKRSSSTRKQRLPRKCLMSSSRKRMQRKTVFCNRKNTRSTARKAVLIKSASRTNTTTDIIRTLPSHRLWHHSHLSPLLSMPLL